MTVNEVINNFMRELSGIKVAIIPNENIMGEVILVERETGRILGAINIHTSRKTGLLDLNLEQSCLFLEEDRLKVLLNAINEYFLGNMKLCKETMKNSEVVEESNDVTLDYK